MSQGDRFEITILGCGSSSGVPVAGCECAVCQSGHPGNVRTRTSCHLAIGDLSFVIDTGPDFRSQMLREGVKRLDAVLYTHPHADHLNGIDDIRAYNNRHLRPIDVYGNAFTIGNMTERFGYAFMPPNGRWNTPVLVAHVVEPGPFEVAGVPMEMRELPHGRWINACYVVGGMAWFSDISDMDDETVEYLRDKKLEHLFIDCLMPIPYPSHLSSEQAFAYAERIGAERTHLVDMTHKFDYEELSRMCPPGVDVCVDGMKFGSSF